MRRYQLDAQQAIVENRKRGSRSQLVSLATGLGKSVVIATLPELLELRPNDVTLVIAHRDELIGQLVEKFKAQNPNAVVGVEKADSVAPDASNVVVATVQTLGGARLDRFVTKFGRRIALFVIDEAHHAAAPTYRAIVDKILNKRPDALVIGFTATPQRGDGMRLGEIFPATVYKLEAREAIEAGFLVPVRSYAVATDVDLDKVASRAGDFVIGQLADAVDNDERNAAVLDAYERLIPGKKTLIFAASVAHARHIAELFADAGIKVAFASGETPTAEREAIVAGFRGDRIDVLVNCGLYLEGFDVPSIAAIVNARPTKSTTLYTQMTGRALRPLDEDAFPVSNFPTPEARRQYLSESRKPFATIVDIVDQARKHQLVTLPTLWGMPSQIDAQGRLISGLAEEYEELFKLAPRDAARARDAETIETALARAKSGTPNGAAAVWQMITPEHWRLERPPEKIARDRSGRLIPNFERAFAEKVAVAKRIHPSGNAEAFAERMLNLDRRSIATVSAIVEIARRDDSWVASFSDGVSPALEVLSAPTLPDAINAASTRLESGAFAPPARRFGGGAAKKRGPKRFRARKKRTAPAATAQTG